MAHYGPMPQGRTALYRLLNAEDRLLYIGISCNPQQRLKAHHGRSWWHEVKQVKLEWFPSRPEAEAAERLAIRTDKPQHNIAETALHRRLAGRLHNPLTPDEWARWEAASTGGPRRAAIFDARTSNVATRRIEPDGQNAA